jgi:hypothetical protein
MARLRFDGPLEHISRLHVPEQAVTLLKQANSNTTPELRLAMQAVEAMPGCKANRCKVSYFSHSAGLVCLEPASPTQPQTVPRGQYNEPDLFMDLTCPIKLITPDKTLAGKEVTTKNVMKQKFSKYRAAT